MSPNTRNILFIGVAIGILYLIKCCLPKKKEGFLDAQSQGVVAGSILLIILVTAGIAYWSYSIKEY